jgi:hypothetical protein
MNLYQNLKTVTTEEDVKDIYIKALGLKKYRKGLVDILTDEIWFEAKLKPTSSYEMFTQLLHYVHDYRKEKKRSQQRSTSLPFLVMVTVSVTTG